MLKIVHIPEKSLCDAHENAQGKIGQKSFSMLVNAIRPLSKRGGPILPNYNGVLVLFSRPENVHGQEFKTA